MHPGSTYRYIGWLMLCILGFILMVLLRYTPLQPVLSELDFRALLQIQEARIRSLDGVMIFLTNTSTYMTVGILAGLLIYAAVRRSKAGGTRAMYFFFAFMLGALLSNTLKQIIGRERPFVTYHDIEKLSTGGSPSFPSGHTTEVFCAATILALLYGRHPAVILAFVWAALVAYTRMALGVHYPGDVIGASMLGMASALIVKLTLDYILERRRM